MLVIAQDRFTQRQIRNGAQWVRLLLGDRTTRPCRFSGGAPDNLARRILQGYLQPLPKAPVGNREKEVRGPTDRRVIRTISFYPQLVKKL